MNIGFIFSIGHYLIGLRPKAELRCRKLNQIRQCGEGAKSLEARSYKICKKK